MKKLFEAKAAMDKMKERLDSLTVEGISPEAKVRVEMTGNRRVKGIVLDTNIRQEEDMLEDYLVMAMNDALTKADALNESEMRAAAGNMMPGMGGLFG